MHEGAKIRTEQPKAKIPNLTVDFAEQMLSRISECDNTIGAVEGRANQFLGRGIAANHFI